jgi:site-specific DNA-methyltransferase (adenine-specific)
MLEVREVEVSKLKPWEKNPRINDHAVEAVAGSITSFGFNVPILHDQNFTIIAGHTRWKAAQKLGMAHVPAIMLNLSDTERKSFSVADNKLASLAKWDEELLATTLKELDLDRVYLPPLGFSKAELAWIRRIWNGNTVKIANQSASYYFKARCNSITS